MLVASVAVAAVVVALEIAAMGVAALMANGREDVVGVFGAFVEDVSVGGA